MAEIVKWFDPGMILSSITAIALLVGLYLNMKSNQRTAKTEQTRLYFAIAEKWTEVLAILYEVRRTPPPSVEELEQAYGDVSAFMATADWKTKYRVICNFFEDIGLIAYNENLPLATIRVLVTISADDYKMMKPVLDFVRANYRSDIYHFWNYLLQQSARAKPIRPFKGGKLYEPR